MSKANRHAFEAFISSPPFEADISRFPNDPTKHAWPGNYESIEVQLAWKAWEEALREKAELLEALRNLFMHADLSDYNDTESKAGELLERLDG